MAVLPTGIGPVTGYNIERSLRFNSADSAYLNRTPASAGNRKTWTWSGWIKRCATGTTHYFFSGGTGTSDTTAMGIRFTSDDTFRLTSYTTDYRVSSSVYRDLSAWYHVVVAFDTTQATASNRIKIYINGSQVTAFSTSNDPTLNADYGINQAQSHSIGRWNQAANNYTNGYLTEVNFIDGSALTPSSFGETDSATGVWKPKAYSGTYGTNGFYLNFSDNSGTTSTTLGKDSSGNGNNWTPNNFSVTAGAGNDSLVDSPTSYGTDTGVGGTVRGNYATWNPIYTIPSNTTTSFTNGNLDFSVTQAEGTGTASAVTTMPLPTTGKWYWEVTPSAVATTATRTHIGVMAQSQINYAMANGSSGTPGSTGQCFAYSANGQKVNDATYTNYGNSYTANDVIGIAVDLDNNAIYFSKNGTWQNSGDPTSGSSKTGAAYTTLSGSNNYFPGIGYWIRASINFGQRAFAYTAPSGFKALCTTNLPTPTIGATSTTQANDYFNVKTYTGTGTQQSLTGVGFQPDFIWFKSRSAAVNHALIDAVRGRSKILFSSLTDAEATSTTTAKDLVSFDADGFTVGVPEQNGSINNSGASLVAWNWNAGGSTVTNTSGTISAQVRANTTSGFSIVSYTGNGTGGATVGHGLGVAPSMIIIKNSASASFSWGVYHASVGNTAGLYLNLTNAAATTSIFWNNTSPTSSVFTVGSWGGTNNTSAMIAYCFAPVAGYSAFGSYTGNGSTDGPFVYTGFRPKYVLVKRTDTTGNWQVFDGARDTYNFVDLRLQPNLSNAEAAGTTSALYFADFLSNGFKIVGTDTDWNASSSTYIYAAFAESPFKYALAR